MRKRLNTIALAVIAFAATSCKPDNPAMVAGDIIRTFENGCSSSGPWRSAAIAQSESLVSIFERLKEVDQCQQMGSVLENMHGAATAIHGSYNRDDYLAYLQTKEELQELTFTLENTTDPTLQQQLSEEILTRQIELARDRAARSVYDEQRDRIGYNDEYSQNATAVAGQFKNLFNQAPAISACLQQSPSSAIGLFGSLSAIAGSFVSPVLGNQMNAVSGMMNTFLNYARYAQIDGAIYQAYEAQMPEALTCAMESMTNFYCQAHDATIVLKAQVDSYREPGKSPTNFWKGIDLLVNRLPVLNNWLNNVASGIEPRKKTFADEVIEVRKKKNFVTNTEIRTNTILNEADDEIRGGANRSDTLVEAVIQIATRAIGFCGHNCRNDGSPFNRITRSLYLHTCYLVEGLNADCKEPTGNNADTRNYIRNLPSFHLLTVNKIRTETWPLVFNRVSSNVNKEFNDVIFINPKLLLAAAQEDNQAHGSPLESLHAIRGFLVEFLEFSADSNAHRNEPIDDLLHITTRAIEVIVEGKDFIVTQPVVLSGEIPPAIGEEIVELNPLIEIYEMFKLEVGTQFYSDTLAQFVDWDLNDKLEAGEFPKDLEDIIRSARGEIFHRLTASGVNNFDSILDSLGAAKRISSKNFEVFGDFMSQQITKYIKELYEEAKEEKDSGEDFNAYSTRALARMCVMIFASDSWPKENRDNKRVKEICRKTTLWGVHHRPEGKLKIELAQVEKDIGKIQDPKERRAARTCVFYKFRRAERLAEIIKDRLHRPINLPELSAL